MKKKGTVLFIPHGGGPLPILGDPRHKEIIKFLKNIKLKMKKLISIFYLLSFLFLVYSYYLEFCLLNKSTSKIH